MTDEDTKAVIDALGAPPDPDDDIDQVRTERDALRQENNELRDACAALLRELNRTRERTP
jgi:hypothetical protein